MPPDARFIPVYRPWVDEREARAAARPILSGWLTMGPEVEAFEREFAAFVGARHACAVSSCTTALHLALLGAGVEPGDNVVTVSHTFIATSNCIHLCGATPRFVDIRRDTFNMDPGLIEDAMTPKTRAILCVHQIGMPCDMEAILEVAQRHEVVVVEDCACGIGSEIRIGNSWQRLGRPHGAACCFSFHPRKLLTTGDGGMITTANSAWDERFRRLRHHGMNVTTTARHTARQVIFETYPEPAFNYRMTDIQAAVGREQLHRMPEIVQRRRQMAERYRRLLQDIPGVEPPVEPSFARSNWQSYCVRLADHLDQRKVMQALLDHGIATRRGIMCVHREPAYAHIPLQRSLAESEQAQDHCILLPLYHQLTEEEQDYVVERLREIAG